VHGAPCHALLRARAYSAKADYLHKKGRFLDLDLGLCLYDFPERRLMG
jgi:hypothetical protein